jgi:uncharacterized integral membrane protein
VNPDELSAAPGQAGPPAPPPSSGIQVSGAALASGAGIALLVTFMAQNTDDVRVDLLFWHITVSVWLLVLLSALLGAVVWFALGVLRRHRRRVDRREARREARD